MLMAAPERTESSSGRLGSPKREPVEAFETGDLLADLLL